MATLAERVTPQTDNDTATPAEKSTSAPTQEQKIDWSEDNGQLDGATAQEGGNMMEEPEYDVEVKLIDETLSEYSSVVSFDELGM